MSVRVIDAFMGSGKTTYIMNQIEQRCGASRFLYISPLLSEVGDPEARDRAPELRKQKQLGRIGQACPSANFKQPKTRPSKSKHLKHLLAQGENIACTHKLFELMDEEAVCLIKEQRYEIIIDEALDAVQGYTGLREGDNSLLANWFDIDKGYQVHWQGPDDCRYEDVISLCNDGRLFNFRGRFYVCELSPSLITNAKSVTILTYLFEASIMAAWMRVHDIAYTYEDNESIGLKSEPVFLAESKELISFCESPYVEKMAAKSLSAIGYNNMNNSDLKRMKGQLEKMVERHISCNSSDLIWTCYGKQKATLKGKGYARSHVPCNVRATNDYSNRSIGLYLIDRYQHQNIKVFLEAKGQTLDDDLFGLSEMIQWIWRLRIRNSEPITLAIPSQRMRDLLTRWLNGEFIRVHSEPMNVAA